MDNSSELKREHQENLKKLHEDHQKELISIRREYEEQLSQAHRQITALKAVKLVTEPRPKPISSTPPVPKRPRVLVYPPSLIPNPHILVCGVRDATTFEQYKSAVESIKGGTFLDPSSPSFPESATHVVMPSGYRSLRTIYALFSGRWCLSQEWLDRSVQCGYWIDERCLAIESNTFTACKLDAVMMAKVRTLRHTKLYKMKDPSYGQISTVMAALKGSFSCEDEGGDEGGCEGGAAVSWVLRWECEEPKTATKHVTIGALLDDLLAGRRASPK